MESFARKVHFYKLLGQTFLRENFSITPSVSRGEHLGFLYAVYEIAPTLICRLYCSHFTPQIKSLLIYKTDEFLKYKYSYFINNWQKANEQTVDGFYICQNLRADGKINAVTM